MSRLCIPLFLVIFVGDSDSLPHSAAPQVIHLGTQTHDETKEATETVWQFLLTTSPLEEIPRENSDFGQTDKGSASLGDLQTTPSYLRTPIEGAQGETRKRDTQ